jgi:ribonuclease HIII
MAASFSVPPGQFLALREFLSKRGYKFEARPYQEFLARGHDTVVNLYTSGKLVIGGSSLDEERIILKFIGVERPGRPKAADSRQPQSVFEGFHGTRIGSDEVGKGDYFGPLIACAVLATEYQATRLKSIGVRDSKKLNDTAIVETARSIRDEVLERGQWRLVIVPPIRYNLLMREMGNLNRLLAWAHARAIEDVLNFTEPCSLAIADQFGDPKYIEHALMAKGRRIELVQTPQGERDVVVAAASVLARAEFLDQMEKMSQRYGAAFPRGASNVEGFAKALVMDRGPSVLLDTAKIHFATTDRIVDSRLELETALLTRGDHNSA